MSGSSPLPFVVGLTGNIGTGKSTVIRMMSELGAEVIDADKVAHEVMHEASVLTGSVAAGARVCGRVYSRGASGVTILRVHQERRRAFSPGV